MQNEIIIAGFGGQGVLFGGMLLAQAAVEENKQTTWFPSYGAEIRGGTANSTVVISDEEIGSPIAARPSGIIVLNEPSLIKFLPKAKEGAIIIANSSLCGDKISCPGSKVVCIPASDIADKELGDSRVTNLVMVGAYLKASGILKLRSAQDACEKALKGKPKLVDINKKALELGYNYNQD
jgi:2-oxoglutarate ferredoxin oxidoreductase subunit gamma